MSLTSSGVKTPLSFRQQILHLERARLATKKARRVEKRQRANNQQRLKEPDRLLAELIDGADVVAQADAGDLWRGRSIFLLVSLSPHDFNRLAEYGSEREELEDSNDAEPEADDEPSIGVDAPEFDPCDEGEQRNYPISQDRPLIDAISARYNSKPHGASPWAERIYNALDPETKRARAWVSRRRRAAP